MEQVQHLPARADVPEKLTWNLQLIYQNPQAVEQDFQEIAQSVARMNESSVKVGETGDALLGALQDVLKLDRRMTKLAVYTELLSDQDTGDSKAQALNERANGLAAKVAAATAWLEPAIVAIDDQRLTKMIESTPGLKQYQHLFDQIRLQKGHVLSADQEQLLAKAGDIFDSSEKVFGLLNDADFTFPVVQNDQGNDVELTQGVYGVLLQSQKQAVRKQAFEALYRVYHQFRNSLAATLAGQVKVDNFQATVHHYPDAKTAALAPNHISINVYDSLVDSVNQHLDLLHRYVALRKRVLKLSELHMYDMYTPLTPTPPLKYSYPEAQKIVLSAVAVLGSDYQQHVQEAFDSRWIDVVENQNKRSGAYSSGMYDTAPYILLNWQGNIDSLYTLIHEMGHSMHSYLTTHNQPYQYGDYPIFVAEIASTTNENILTDYLLKQDLSPAVRAYVLNYYLDGFKGTVYRQTQFAEFEQWIHEQDQQGAPLTATSLSDQYGRLNQRYYGDAVVSDPQISDEWSRIPHFYYDYYVYQYATGFAAATTLAQRLQSGKQVAVQHYLDYLKSGSSKYPIDTMQLAGVDMTQTGYLDVAFATFQKRLDELENLLDSSEK